MKTSKVKGLHNVWQKVTCLETNRAAFVARADAKALENSQLHPLPSRGKPSRAYHSI